MGSIMMNKKRGLLAAFVFSVFRMGKANALSLEDFGQAIWDVAAPFIGILAIMFIIIIGIGKLWQPNWNPAIKVIMVLVVVIVELACLSVLPIVGVNVQEVFGKII